MSERTSAEYREEAEAAQMQETGGEQLINEWFDLYYDQIYQYLYFMLGDRGGEAEDILQEVFIKAYRNLHTFKGDSSPRTWLTAIARNAALDAMRRKRWTLNDLLAGREEKAPAAEEPERVLLTEERREKMLELLDVLKPAQREVIFFLYQKELSIKETAELLDCTEAKIRTMKHRALRALRKSGEFEEWIGGELSNGD